MNSLAILSPAQTTSNECSKRSATAKHLEELTVAVANIVTTRYWQDPAAEVLVPSFYAEIDHSGRQLVRSREQYLASLREVAQVHHDYNVQVESVCADVREAKRTAVVWMLLKITGDPPNIQRENVTAVHWKRVEGEWRCIKLTSMRGIETAQ